MISTERLKEIAKEASVPTHALYSENRMQSLRYFDCDEIETILSELIEAREKLSILSTMKHDDCTQLAEANEVIKFYSDMQTLGAPDDWDYGGMGGAPTVEQLELKDVGFLAREYQKKWGLK